MPRSIQLDATTTIPLPGFGAMGMSAFYGPTNDEQSKATLRKAIEIGCTLWDTATMYGFGHNEKIIGEVLREGDNRKKVFLVDKYGNRFNKETGEWWVDGSPASTRESFEQSVKDLGGIYPDAYLLHRIDKNTPIEESVKAMEALRQEGKTKYIGLSECSVQTLRRAAAVAKIDFIEMEYSPWSLDIETNGILDACKELDVKILAYSPLGRGFLTGRFKSLDDFKQEGDARAAAYFPRFGADVFEQNLRCVEALEKIADRKGCKTSQLVLAWLMAQSPLIIPIPGTKSEKYLLENFASADVDLSPEEVAEIRAVVEANKPEGNRYSAVAAATLDE
ncbi:hypothetical protein JCM6882_003298 [Rhodosporidiobolus microsporus]